MWAPGNLLTLAAQVLTPFWLLTIPALAPSLPVAPLALALLSVTASGPHRPTSHLHHIKFLVPGSISDPRAPLPGLRQSCHL